MSQADRNGPPAAGRRVLVLDGQTTQALATVRSLGRAGYVVFVASLEPWPLAGWSHFVRERVRLAGETREAFAAMRHWALDRGVDFVLPLTERSCILCNADRDAWTASGITVGCAEETVLSRAFDKAQTLGAAAACGVATPAVRLPRSWAESYDAAHEVGFPCVVKARFSNAWNGVEFFTEDGPSYVSHADELEKAIGAHRQGESWPLVQAFVEGKGKGVFALCDHGRPVMWFAHERLREVRPSGSGSSLRRSVPLDPRLVKPAERLLREMEWHGPAMVEFRDDGTSSPQLMEVNGRFWGSLQLAVAAGADFPRRWMEILEGSPMSAPARYDENVTVRWLWGDLKRFARIVAGRPAGYPGHYPSISQGLRELFGPQPPGTVLETWQAEDRLPAIGELVQAASQLVSRVRWRRKKQGQSSGSFLLANRPILPTIESKEEECRYVS